MKKIILSADSTCDLNDELARHYNIICYPYSILLDGNNYKDNLDIKPNDIFNTYYDKNILATTAAINIGEYYNYFKPKVDEGYEIIHINLSSSLTSGYNNCCLAANEFTGVYPIDSQNLSTGSALLVLKAADLIKKGLSAKEVNDELQYHKEKIHMSFILDTLDFLYAGGRCSKISSLGSNLLKIKPVIDVDNKTGSMGLGNKYRGTLDKVIVKYIKDKLSQYTNINDDRIFLVHSGVEERYINLAKKTISECIDFKEIHVTMASCTISCHCGPNTLGIAFETK